MTRHIPSVYRPAELKEVLSVMMKLGFEERTAVDIIRKLHDRGFRIIKVTPQ